MAADFDDDARNSPTGSMEDMSTAGRPSDQQRLSLTFRIGEIVSGRYRIARFIAQGGMGEVYEAEDQELGERLALKTIRPQIAGDSRTMERFRREVQLARKVTHRNVCRIFDVDHHQRGSEDVAFLTMELLTGDSLARVIRSAGRMTTDQALPIVKQMVAALDAAHHVGIIHRDFKSGNVLLVKEKEQVRVVVTDFGLARTSSPNAASLSGTGEIVGTPAYMAPEQIEGEEITPAVDIYALGVVMYEMVTGRLPFSGDTPVAIALKRLKERPSSPREHVASLDRKWESAILRCLEKEPARRFQRSDEVLKFLEGEKISAPSGKRLSGILVASLFAIIAIAIWRFVPENRTPTGPAIQSAAPVKIRRSVAVLGFKNLTGQTDAAWISTALSEMLTSELGAGEKLRTIPGENVARIKRDLELPDAESFAGDTLKRIRSSLGADYVVFGSYFVEGDPANGRIRLDLRLEDALQGELIASMSETESKQNILNLVSHAGAQLRQKLGAEELTQTQTLEARASQPSNPEAARLYAEGLSNLRRFNYLQARDLFQQSIAADPKFALSHSAISRAWSGLGYGKNAAEEAKKASDLSAGMSREDRLWIEAQLQDSEKAIEDYRALFRFYPDNLEYGLGLAGALADSGRGKEALTTIEALRKLPRPISDDARIDLQEEGAFLSLPDYNRAQMAAQRTITKAQQQNSPVIEAQARMMQADILSALNRDPERKATLDRARAIYAKVGDRSAEADALMAYDWNTKDVTQAVNVYQECLTLYRQIGNKLGEARALRFLGVTYRLHNETAKAIKSLESALAIHRELDNKGGMANQLWELSAIYADQIGDLRKAKESVEECLSLYRQAGNQDGVIYAQYGLAATSVYLGELSAAKKNLIELLSTVHASGDKGMEEEVYYALASVLIWEGDLKQAQQYADQAMRIKKITESRWQWTSCAYANLLLEEGKFSEAQKFAEAFGNDSTKLAARRACTLEVAVRSLLAQGKLVEAKNTLNQALSLVTGDEDFSERFVRQVTEARLLAASGKPADVALAIKNLNSTIAESKKLGWLYYELDARLALGQIEIASGDKDRGRVLLLALQKEAAAKDQGLVAGKAAAALSKIQSANTSRTAVPTESANVEVSSSRSR